MTRQLMAAAVLFVWTAVFAQAQDSFTRNFKPFKDIVPGIDFFAASRSDVTPFEKPIKEARERLATFLGKDMARGALVICSTLEQKDSVTESRLLRMGYRWTLLQFTPEVASQQMLAQIKAQMGGQIPPLVLERIKSPSPEMRAASMTRLAASAAQKVGNAILVTTLAPDTPFRSSRLDDMAKSPLADWIDVGILSYAAGTGGSTLRFLQERIEDAFPLEDIISMSRPFVAPTIDGVPGGGGGQLRLFSGGGANPSGSPPPGAGGGVAQMRIGGPGGDPGGASAGGSPSARSGDHGNSGGLRQGGMTNLPKDVQDRMLFDAESSSFFAYIMEKLGVEKCKAVVQASLENKNVREVILRPDMLGSDFDAVEAGWQSWLKNQKPEGPANFQIFTTTPGRPGAKP